MIKPTPLFLCVLLMLSTPSVNVFAKTYKCIDENGETTYSQRACPNDQKTDKVMGGGGKTAGMEDCKYARQFAEDTARRMQSGVDVHQTFDGYGGVDSISKSTLAIINYVYTYKDVSDVSAARIASLTAASCNAKAFGTVACEDFPQEFRISVNNCGQKLLSQSPPAPSPVAPAPNPETDADYKKAQDARTILWR